VTVMERFDAPTDRAVSTMRDAALEHPWDRLPRAAAPPASEPEPASVTGWDGDAIVVPTSSYVGLLALGAVAGTTAAAVFGAVVGWSGTLVTFAALVGLDVGVLVGAGIGGLVARRQRRRGDRRGSGDAGGSTRGHEVAVEPAR
jgi:hypothetical protein